MLKKFRVRNNFPRLVLVGNSNVGKSTIAKYFLKDKKLATGAIGKHAGSTVTLKSYKDPNLPFEIIDLPGFGAMTRTSKQMKERTHTGIIEYVERDKANIFLIMVVISGIRVLDELERWYYQTPNTIPLTFEFMSWISEVKLPCILVINKIDRLKTRELTQIVQEIKKVLKEFHIEIDEYSPIGLQKIFMISAKKKVNMQELKIFVEERFTYAEQ